MRIDIRMRVDERDEVALAAQLDHPLGREMQDRRGITATWARKVLLREARKLIKKKRKEIVKNGND